MRYTTTASLALLVLVCWVGCEDANNSPDASDCAGCKDVDDSSNASDCTECEDIGDSSDVPVQCVPEDWVARARLQSFDNQDDAGPPPYEGPAPPTFCEPVIDQSCATVCDCRYIHYGCYLRAANKNQPWNNWPMATVDKDGMCFLWTDENSTPCDPGIPSPRAPGMSLACTDGTCEVLVP